MRGTGCNTKATPATTPRQHADAGRDILKILMSGNGRPAGSQGGSLGGRLGVEQDGQSGARKPKSKFIGLDPGLVSVVDAEEASLLEEASHA